MAAPGLDEWNVAIVIKNLKQVHVVEPYLILLHEMPDR
jgi:hypothetical protein